MNTRTITMLAAAAILFVASGATAQSVRNCEADDKECLKSQEQSGTTVSKEEPKVEDAEPKASFDPRLFATRKTNTFYRPKPADEKTEAQEVQASAEDAQELAKKLSNPVAALISLPLQSTFDFGMGPTGDGFRYTLTVQPVIPIKLNEKWNLISRTVTPIMGQKDVIGPSSEFGLGDIIQTLLISPNRSEPLIWGLGPQVLIPTATNGAFASKKLGIGPALLVMKQKSGWTYGLLSGHIWSVAGSDSRPSVSTTNLQPILSYNTKTAWTYAFNTESTYDWTGKQWNVPIHFNVTKLVKLGTQRVSVGAGLRCWAVSSPNGPSGCGFRILFTPLFPK